MGTKADSHFKQYKFSSFTGIYHSFRPQLHVNPVNPVYKIESVKVELINMLVFGKFKELIHRINYPIIFRY